MKSIQILPGSGDNFYCENCVRDNATVRALLKAGEEVVSGSYAAISRKLKDGSKVMIEKPKQEEAAK